MATTTHQSHPRAAYRDPANTEHITVSLTIEFFHHWKHVFEAIETTIAENDALALTGGGRSRGFGFGSQTRQLFPTDFGARTTAERVDAMSEWFGYTVAYRLADEQRPAARRRGGHYTAESIRRAYIRGIQAADLELRQAGYDVPTEEPASILADASHADHLARVYAQTYHDVQAVCEGVETDVVRTLAEQLRDGATPAPAALAASLADRVRAVGIERTDLISIARVVDAVNSAALERYSRFGVPRLRVIGGVSDRDVEKQTFSIAAIRGGEGSRPPLHPRDTRFLVPAA